jgi:hypothetical protein
MGTSLRPMSSEARIEVFRRLRSGNIEWVETVDTLERAFERSEALASQEPAKYFIFDRENARFIDPTTALSSQKAV